VVILELRRAEIAERGLESARVVSLVDEAWKISGDVLEGFRSPSDDGLDLQCLHEALGLGIANSAKRLPLRVQ
jgi:hypothetical protein